MRRTYDKTATIANSKEVEVADIIWYYDPLAREPVMCVFHSVNRDGWLRVKKYISVERDISEWMANLPEKFFATKKECAEKEIERLSAVIA